MAKGKKIAENPELEKFVINLIKKGFIYKDVIQRIEKEFGINISLSLLSHYVRNYLPVDIQIPKERKSALGLNEKTISPLIDKTHSKEIKGRIIDGKNILNFYASRLYRVEIVLDQIQEKKKELTKGEIKNFNNLVELQDKLYQRVLEIFKDEIRKKEIMEIIWRVCSLVVDLFFKNIKKEEENIYRKKIDKFEKGIFIIVKEYLGEGIEELFMKSLDQEFGNLGFSK